MTAEPQYTDTEAQYPGASKVERIVNFVHTQITLGADKHERAFARLNDDAGNPTCYPLHGQDFRNWLQYSAYQHGDVLKNEDMSEVLSLLNAHARFDGEKMTVYLRSAQVDENTVELDCADEDNTRIRLQNGEVALIESGSEVLFYQSQTQQPLVTPAAQGDWQALLPFLNMSEQEKFLFLGWLTYLLAYPRGKSVGYPLLIVKGEQGAGKSFLCKAIIRGLVDPNVSGIQLFPKDPKDLIISSQNSRVLIYDNLRKLSKDWSDVLCIAATSGTLSTRKLYTDSEESIMHLHAPVVLNGIHNFVEEPDLASRCLNIQLLPMEAEHREHENLLESRLNTSLPGIFRGLLELAAQALQQIDQVEVTCPERMLGYVHWLAALEQVMDLPMGELQQAYRSNLRQAMLDTIQENLLAYTVLQFAKQYNDEPWRGRPQDLLTTLDAHAPRRIRSNPGQWPQNAIALSKRLSALHKSLSAQGVILQIGDRGKHRQITLGFEPPENH